MRVRAVEEGDLAAIAEIVNHYIISGAIHFAEEPQTSEAWRDEWQPLRQRYPWLVAERDGHIVGVAWAKPWNKRAAYDWTTEVAIYLSHGHLSEGIGAALYARLLRTLDMQGYRTIVVGITIPNDPSVALHESFGFRFLGTLEKIGFKQGAWHDVGLWQRRAAGEDGPPAPIKSLAEISEALND